MNAEMHEIRALDRRLQATARRLEHLAERKRELVRRLVDAHGPTRTAQALGITRARVNQIIARRRGNCETEDGA